MAYRRCLSTLRASSSAVEGSVITLEKYAKEKVVLLGTVVGSVVTICGTAVAVNQALLVAPREAMEMKVDIIRAEVLNNRGAMEVEVQKSTLRLEEKILRLDSKMGSEFGKLEQKMDAKMDMLEARLLDAFKNGGRK